MLYANALVLRFLDTFKEFPPRSEPASFTITAAVEKLKKAIESGGRLSLAGLDSWRDGPTKSAIVDFVGPGYHRRARISLSPKRVSRSSTTTARCGCEKPAYVQLDFLVRRLAEQAAADPSLAEQAALRGRGVR